MASKVPNSDLKSLLKFKKSLCCALRFCETVMGWGRGGGGGGGECRGNQGFVMLWQEEYEEGRDIQFVSWGDEEHGGRVYSNRVRDEISGHFQIFEILRDIQRL